ncbi:hypothetical protein [Microbacterium sp. Leaf203]|uniref:hypothetical protein n=1 Tax=Microbacterium sp. Leaf203 TaxID=1735677 RepID=UPI0006F7AF5C|nr:hypothetical protein [Microbacterium sp. Leaf203]KQM36845.1 hypothetical protein ASE56_10550 [Microbacterium sp. Leaf203]
MTDFSETTDLPDGAVEIRGLSLDEIWGIAHRETYMHDGREFVPMLSYREVGSVAEPVLYLSRDFV